jgi:hypothetical protein
LGAANDGRVHVVVTEKALSVQSPIVHLNETSLGRFKDEVHEARLTSDSQSWSCHHPR